MKKLLLIIFLASFLQQSMAQAPRKVLIEDFTGTWCGNCPMAADYIEQTYALYPSNVISVGLHGPAPYYYNLPPYSYGGGDTMYCSYSGNLAYYYMQVPTGSTSFPSVMVDRVDWSSMFGASLTPQIVPGAIPSHNYIKDISTTRVSVSSPVSIEITSTYNPTTRAVSATVKANFVDTVSGTIKINCLLVEDSVVGNGYWSQDNYFGKTCSDPQTGTKYYNYPCIITTALAGAKPFYHHNVVRWSLSGTWGSGGIPTSVAKGANYSHTYSYPALPSAWNAANMKIVAFVSFYNTTAALGGEVLNAEEVTLGQNTVGIPENPSAKNSVSFDAVFPNPFNQIIQINVNVPATQHVSVKIYDILGHQVATLSDEHLSPGEHTFYWDGKKSKDGSALANGLYLVRLQTEKQSLSRSIVLERN